MADLTRFRSGHMQCTHAGGDGAIMATRTGSDHFCMIHRSDEWNPAARRGMAGVAIVCGINMHSGFADGDRAVMTTDTGADNLVMIHCGGQYWSPRSRCQMTGFTDIRCIYMDRALT